MNSSFLLVISDSMDDYENQHTFSQMSFLQHHNLKKKKNVFNSYIRKIFFHQSFSDIGRVYERSKYMCWFI